jgi:hypothetical protein
MIGIAYPPVRIRKYNQKPPSAAKPTIKQDEKLTTNTKVTKQGKIATVPSSGQPRINAKSTKLR